MRGALPRHLAPLLLGPMLLSGCGALTKLSEVGKPPEMTPTADPTKDPSYRPLTMPMPEPQLAAPEPNALWRTGSRAFFKDQRAARVGDLLTVTVAIADSANLQDNSNISRTSSETMGLPNLFGLEAALPHLLTKSISPSSLVSATSTNSNVGSAQLTRNETVTLSLAATVTQVLANGNLVISASQEVRVNSELRQLLVTGVIRPQDIQSDNTVPHDRIAEARISYGGRGQITDVQTPRWGERVLDAILPF